jgi:DHA1 family bicyclomycin/chloramphenicol resistance-like MFS transporter
MERGAGVRLSPRSLSFTLLLGALVTFASFATDMALPVLTQMGASLGVAPGRAALSLSVFMAGFALAPLVFGPVSDHVGRRPVLLTSCAMFALFGGLGAFSRSLGALLLWRLLMGSGAGGCQVLVVAMVRDFFTGVEARVKQSYVNLAAGVAPVIAPTLGVAIAALGGWRAIYGALALGGTLLFIAASLGLQESRQGKLEGALSARRAVAGYVRVLTHRLSVGYILLVALNFGCLFAYVSGSSLVLINVLGVSQRVYGMLFAATSLGLMVGSLSSARLSRRGVSHHRLITWGIWAIVGTALMLLGFTFAGIIRAVSLVPVVVIGFIGQGIVRPNAVQGALEPVPDIAGVASAVLSALQMLCGALASALVAALFDGRSAIAMTSMMAICAVTAAGVYAFVVRPAERERTAGHGVRDAGRGTRDVGRVMRGA